MEVYVHENRIPFDTQGDDLADAYFDIGEEKNEHGADL
jgi:hypothetical protein